MLTIFTKTVTAKELKTKTDYFVFKQFKIVLKKRKKKEKKSKKKRKLHHDENINKSYLMSLASYI